MDNIKRRLAMQLNGVDAELWGPEQVREKLPLMTQSLDSRYLPNGGVWQRRGGIERDPAGGLERWVARKWIDREKGLHHRRPLGQWRV